MGGMTNTERLKPCPFCGSINLLVAGGEILDQVYCEQQSAEPVALESVYETIIQWDEGGGKRSRRDLARRVVALYTHPPQRKTEPLSDEQIAAISDAEAGIGGYPFIFARRIERAHGITATEPGEQA